MSTVTRPRGPLPARVYWFRRLLLLLVLGTAVGLVVGLAGLFGGGGTSGGPSAQPAAVVTDPPSSGPSSAAAAVLAAQDGTQTSGPTSGPVGQPGKPGKPGKKGKKGRHGLQVPLAVPTGPCQDTDVRVTPSVDTAAHAGEDVRLTLNLTTVKSPACTWEVSSKTVALKLTSGSDRIWSTQDCPSAVPTQQVTVRQGRFTKVYVTWNGQRSDGTCSRTTPWAEPGYYHAEAAAFGADPVDVQFELLGPRTQTITPTPTPSAKASGKATAKASASPTR